MSQDFSGQNLRGRSFKGQNLEGADFSYADIRGANFKGANLRGANFTGAKAGLESHWMISLVVVAFLLAVLSGFLLGFGAFLNTSLFTTKSNLISVRISWLSLILISVYFIAIFRKDTSTVLGFGSVAIAISVIVIITLSFVENGNPFWGSFALAGVVFLVAAGTGDMILNLSLSLSWALGLNKIQAMFIILLGILIWIRSGVVEGIEAAIWAGANPEIGTQYLANFLVLILAGLSGCINCYSLNKNGKNLLFKRIAIHFAAISGTSFINANLTDTDFTSATLENVDWRKSDIIRTRFYDTKKLDFGRIDGTILANRNILDLLVTGNGREKSYVGANLKGANLKGADLKEANLKNADLTKASFKEANLEWANLTRTQVNGTDFSNALMTGACVQAWNIENTTKLENVDCRFVYLLENPKPNTDDKERRPSSGEFARGEFTKVFQEVLNTVDIIFRDGIDWKAFIQSFRQVQVENEGTELSINSIENKGDGVFIIKINTDINTNKQKIHSELEQRYEEKLQALEERFNVKIKAKDRDVDKSRQRYTDIQEITKILADKQVSSISQAATEKVIVLKFDSLSEATDLFVTTHIWVDNNPQPLYFEGKLPPVTEIIKLYNDICYLINPEENRNRAGLLKVKVVKSSSTRIQSLSDELKTNINNWFNSPSFLNVANQLRSKLNPSDSIRFIIQTSDIKLKLLPLHLWDFFDDYRKAEIALSTPQSDRLSKSIANRNKVRVLVILGNSKNIETGVQADLEALNQLPLSEIEILSQPNKQDLHEQLWHPLGWDILCFSGHSDSEDDGSTGVIEISPTEQLSLKYLKSALINAIEKGLQLAIFNSCKGLGIAQDLAELHIPQIIVMRQPVPDEVAQVFLKNFLQAFANGKSLYNSVREARQKLEGLEDRYPCASWLPVICQNPAEVPLRWLQFPGAGEPQLENLLTQLHRLIEEDYVITPDAQAEALEQVKLITEALQIQDELVDKKQVKTNITLLRGIIAGQPAANSLLVEVNEVLTDIYRLCDLN